eukprot:CAMPEP_0117840886 /NCGR_PEP_ID=MMETSP0949-20121206/14947_1 /TAXON_ID=44440 /ORGANISM="Chattonella subsalsa, Strain CCMP2191" /LENGTH=281 /DNA_ID=CAMNT_0005684351 /DNA_START=33 /DNA_END=878 /DNA_ORIENTATION=+
MAVARDFKPFPYEILPSIASFCQNSVIARLHWTCKSFKDSLEDAAEGIYQEASLRSWSPLLCSPQQLALYGGSWKRLFLSKCSVDRAFSEQMNMGATALQSLVEMAQDRSLHRCTTTQSITEFEDFMRATFSLGAKLHLRQKLQWDKTKAFRGYIHQTKQLLESDLMQSFFHNFVYETEEKCGVYDIWHGGFLEWPNIPWRRSAIEFYLQFYGPELPPSPEEMTMDEMSRFLLAGLVHSLDEAIRSVGDEAMDLFVKPVPGVPKSHWWWDFCGTFRGGGFH